MSSKEVNCVSTLTDVNLVSTTKELVPELSILRDLKQRTATHHRALEETAGIWNCLKSRASYGNLLLRFLGIYSVLETRLAALEELPKWLPDMSERWKLPALKSDLAILGVAAEVWEVGNGSPDIQTVAAAFGCLYVLEGSTLGGQMITREVSERLGMEPQTGCQFFSSYGSRVGQMWKIFGQSLECFCSTNPRCRDEITASAEATFSYFSRSLSRDRCAL